MNTTDQDDDNYNRELEELEDIAQGVFAVNSDKYSQSKEDEDAGTTGSDRPQEST